MQGFQVIDDENLWNKSLKLIEFADPCHGFSFHKTYQLHQNAKSIKLLEYRENDQFVLYPLIIYDVPNDISKEKFKYATSAYGFTGHLIKGSEEFVDTAFSYIDDWIIKEKICAEFVRFTPFINWELERLEKYKYQISRNRILAIWDTKYKSSKSDSSEYECNMTKRAKKSGAIFREIKQDELNLFQNLYNQTMLLNNADTFFFYSNEYFENLYQKELFHKNFIYGVFHNKKLIAAAWFIVFKNIAVYHLGCNNRDIPGVSNYVLKEGIRDLVMNKDVSKINLTGGRTEDAKDSLLRFKLSISNSKKDFFVGKRTIMPNIYKEFISRYDYFNQEIPSNKFIPWS